MGVDVVGGGAWTTLSSRRCSHARTLRRCVSGVYHTELQRKYVAISGITGLSPTHRVVMSELLLPGHVKKYAGTINNRR